MDEYNGFVTAFKALAQGESAEEITLPVAEDEWNTRPDSESYGLVSLDFEAGQLNGDGRKMDVSYEGSADLFSRNRSGAGWVPLICGLLETHFGSSWSLNSHTYERETGLFHWDWTFEAGGR